MPGTYRQERLVVPRGHLIRRRETERVDSGTGEAWYREWTNLYVKVIEFPEDTDLPESNRIYSHELAMSCGLCDETLTLEIREDGTVGPTTDCPYAKGIRTVVEIDVPSGKLVVADSLRDVYDPETPYPEYRSYNTAYGQHQVIEANAKVGCAFGPVGNSCPSLWEIEPGRYVVANEAFDWDNDDEDYDGEPFSLGGKAIAGICTDLWAYSLADHDDYVAKGGNVEHVDGVVEIPAGRYRLTHHTGEQEFDWDSRGEEIYAHFELVDAMVTT